jgi:hypothetical protein
MDISMNEVLEYRRHAIRCRQLAAEIEGFEKKYLMDMAVEWERLASEAEAQMASRRSATPDQ